MKLSVLLVVILLMSCQSSGVSTDDIALAQEYYEIGLDYAAVKKNDKAVVYFKKALLKNQKLVAASYNLSISLSKIGSFQEAIDVLSNIQESNDKVLELKAYLLVQLGNKKQAETLYQELIVRNPGSFKLFYNLSKITEDKDLATKSIDEAIKLKPEDNTLLLLKAEILNKFKDFESAIATLQDLMTKDPNNNDAKFSLAKALLENKQFETSYDLFKELSQKNKYEKKYLLNLIAVQVAMGQTDEQIQPNIEDAIKNFSLKDNEIQDLKKGLSPKLQSAIDLFAKNKPKSDPANSDPAPSPK